MDERAPCARRPDQPAAASSGSSPSACPTARSSAPTRARPRTGLRATCSSATRHDGVALGQPRDDGARRAVRDRGEVRPSRTGRSVALVGDGAMQMNGMAELITVAKYWRAGRTRGSSCSCCNNDDLNQVTWEQRAMEGDPTLRRLAGHPGLPVRALRGADRTAAASASTTPNRSVRRGTAALAADRPVLIDAITDPEVPPLPPHITLEQAKHFAESRSGGVTPAAAESSGVVQAEGRGVPSRPVIGARTARGRSRNARASPPTRSRPTRPKSDGTVEWSATTIVRRRGTRRRRDGLGWTYAEPRLRGLISETLAPLVEGRDALAPTANWHA